MSVLCLSPRAGREYARSEGLSAITRIPRQVRYIAKKPYIQDPEMIAIIEYSILRQESRSLWSPASTGDERRGGVPGRLAGNVRPLRH